jgi:hypothetical protein
MSRSTRDGVSTSAVPLTPPMAVFVALVDAIVHCPDGSHERSTPQAQATGTIKLSHLHILAAIVDAGF